MAPGWWRRGVGSALLAAASAADGAFYERRGFRAVAESDGSDNEEREPSVLYERRRPRSNEPTGGTTR